MKRFSRSAWSYTVISEINMTSVGLLVLLLVVGTIDAQNTCSNSRDTCINIRNCPSIIQILTGPRPLSAAALETLRSSQCGFERNDPMVCCPNSVNTPGPQTPGPQTPGPQTPEPQTPGPQMGGSADVPDPPNVTNHPNLRLLDHSMCGPITQQKIIGGNATSIYEFPWMALIAYDTGRSTPEFRCGGTIISNRYILTAAHCVTSLPSGLRLIGVRVGEHDINTERDCERNENGLELYCAERYQDFGIDSFHFHPGYVLPRLHNDIAIIRVNTTMDFRPLSVRPICLPFGSAALLNQRKAIVTGWGATEAGPRSQALLQAKLPLMAEEDCREVYKRSTQIWYKQICAGGQLQVDSCLGDSGGPLQAPGIYDNRTVRTIQYGVVSYGLKQCGTQGYPGVYTKVAYYMDWILDTMTE